MRRQRLGPLPDAATVAATDVEADAFAAADAPADADPDAAADARAQRAPNAFAAPDCFVSPYARSDGIDYRLRDDRQQHLHGPRCVAREPGRRRGDVRPHLDVGDWGGDGHVVLVLRAFSLEFLRM